MNLTRIFITAAVFTILSVQTAFSVPVANIELAQKALICRTQNCDENKITKQQDPIKYLEDKKIRISEKVKEGKISKDKGKEITKKIDSKIKEIKKFDKLSISQKRSKLINHFKNQISKKVKDGKISKEKAEELIKDYTEKINNWDGNGYPHFGRKYFGTKSHHKNKY